METVITSELVKVIETSELEAQTGNYIKEKFLPFFEQAEEWKNKSRELIVTDVNQKHEMQMARSARLALREIRINADKVRKELKEDSLRYGKAVQGVYNVIEYMIVPIEKHLEEQENFVEILEAKRKAELKVKREMELQPYAEFLPLNLTLSYMSEDDYQKLLKGAKLQMQEKIDNEAKAEAERVAKEKKEQEERERIKKENEKLKAENEAKEKELAKQKAKAEKERKELQEKAEKEKRAKEKLEKEMEEKEREIEKEKKEKEKQEKEELKKKMLAEKKANSAPDKKKLELLAKSIEAFQLPELKSEEAEEILQNVKVLLSKVSKFIREKSELI